MDFNCYVELQFPGIQLSNVSNFPLMSHCEMTEEEQVLYASRTLEGDLLSYRAASFSIVLNSH